MKEIIYITEKTEKKINDLFASYRNSNGGELKRFRIEIKGGGCYGYVYKYGMDSTLEQGDILMKIVSDGGKLFLSPSSDSDADLSPVIIDEMSLNAISGSTLKYNIDLSGEEFIMENPKASTECGCGVSFSL